jgi:hypothetical protein
MNNTRGMPGKGAWDLADRRYLSRQRYVLPLLIILGTLVIFIVPLCFRSGLGMLVPFCILLALVHPFSPRMNGGYADEHFQALRPP